MNPSMHLYNQDCATGCREHVPDKTIDLVITDPPYGIKGDTLHRHYNRKEDFVIDGYVEVPLALYPAFTLRWVKELERILRPGGSAYIVSGWTNLLAILQALEATKLRLTNHIIWKYNFGVFTTLKYVTSHYHILYVVKRGGETTFNRFCRFGSSEKDEGNGSLQYQDMEDVWIINREYKPGQKKNKNELPSQLLIKMLQYSSNPGDTVCDLFLGGFSTARVARGMGCNVVGFELNSAGFVELAASVERVEPGSLLRTVRQGSDDTPANTNLPWSEEDDTKLVERYSVMRGLGWTKKVCIDKLGDELGRGRFAILNALKRKGL